MSTLIRIRPKHTLAIGAALAVAVGAPSLHATTYIGPDGGTWHDADNWSDGLPTSSVNTAIWGTAGEDLTVNADSAGQTARFSLGNNGPGTATLNVLPGADLTWNGWTRIGHGNDNATADSWSVVNQTGGSVHIAGDDLHLGRDATTPNTVYQISGGSLTVDRDFRGNNPFTASHVEFAVFGSNAQVNIGRNLDVGNDGSASPFIMHFGIDAGGVSTVQAGGRVRVYNEMGVLKLSMLELPNDPSDIETLTLFDSGDMWDVFKDEQGNLLTEGSNITAVFEVSDTEWWEYTWTISYPGEGGGDGQQTVLSDLEVSFIPEPASAALLLAGGALTMLRRRR